MKKRRVPMTLSLPCEMAKEYDNLAKQESKNKSELFREMFKAYKKQFLKDEFSHLQHYGFQQAKKQRVLTEADIEKIVMQGRRKR